MKTKIILIAVGAFLLGMLCMLIITRAAAPKAEEAAVVEGSADMVEQAEETKPEATQAPAPTKTPEPEESQAPVESPKPVQTSAPSGGSSKPASTPAPVEQDTGFEGEETPLVEPGDILLPEA